MRNPILAIVTGAGLVLASLAACQSTKSAPYVPPTSTQAPTSAVATPSASATPSSSPTSSTRVAGLGQSVTDGNYKFAVQKVECGIGSLPDAGGGPSASPSQGQFCVVVVTETNITNAPQSVPFEASLLDTTGNTYTTDDDPLALTDAQYVYLGPNNQVQAEINPGNRYSDVYLFDLRRGVQPKTVTVHGDYGTAGATFAAK